MPDAIKQVPFYAKFLKDLCTKKKNIHIQKKAFLIENISSILQYKIPLKYKDSGSPTISYSIRNHIIENSMKHISIILGRPFLTIADAHIQCKTGNMQLSFGNMTMELNIFNIAKTTSQCIWWNCWCEFNRRISW